MAKLLKDKVVFITGGTSGIGKETVLVCIREWAKVIFTGRRDEQAHEVVASSCGCDPADILFVKSDVTKPEELQKAVELGIEAFGRIDAVFANAWKHMVGNIVETTLEQWRDMFAVDVEGVFLTLKYTIPYLQKNQQGWSIVLMWSDQCLIGKGESSAYGAAKWAIGQLTKSTAIDYAKDNIRVNCVCPGTVDTPLARWAMKGFADKNFWGDFDKGYTFLEKAQPIQRLGTPQEVGELVAFMLSDRVWFMSGSLVSIDGWYVAG